MALEGNRIHRLNNAEFYNYLPNLQLEEVLMVQIKIKDVWCHLFNATYKGQKQFNTLKCIACQEYIQFDMFSKHLKKNSHLEALKTVDQFYHPTYTYAKTCEKVARGENISKEEIARAIAQTSEAQANYDDITFSVSKSIAKYIREQERDYDKNLFEKTIADLVLSADVKKPDEIVADVKLPLEDLLNVEFSKQEGKWARMLTVNRNANSKFYCALCSKYFFGVLTIDGHFNGTPHKTEQLGCLAVRCLGHPQLTKNCVFGCGKNYLLSIKKKARDAFTDKANEMIISNEILENVKQEEIYVQCENNAGKEIAEGSAAKIKIENNGIKIASDQRDSVSNSSNLNLTVSPTVTTKAQALKNNMSPCAEVEGLIGVEYVVKIIKSEDDINPMYECCLCEIMLTEKRMQSHLVGYNHRLKYCECHYPDTIKKYNNIIGHTKYSNYFNVMGHILSKVAFGIENYHGRSMPFTVSASDFAVKRAEIIEKVYSFRNASQQKGPSFTDVLPLEEIKKIIKDKKQYAPAPAILGKISRFAILPDGKVYLNQRTHDVNKRNSDVVQESRKRIRSQGNKEYQSRSKSPEFGVMKKAKPSDHQSPKMADAWKTYRNTISVASNEVKNKYIEYRKNPEVHPLYDNEWNRFWRLRKEELIKQGIDHRTYNYQPEWVHYFNQRLEELFEEEVKNITNKIHKRFNPTLPMPTENNMSGSLHLDGNMNRQKEIPLSVNDALLLKQTQRSDYTKGFKTGESFLSTSTLENLNKPEIRITDNKPTVIHVLRLLTALEDHLGSLGAKIMDLLSKALMLEKTFFDQPRKLEQSILTFDNCALLETAAEKLKGILFAGLLDDNKVQGFKRVISFTTDLLKHAEKMGWRMAPSSFSEKPNDNFELQKLLEIMQTAKRGGSSLGQKSLSDTLRDLMEKKTNLNSSETLNQNYMNFPNTSSRSQLLGSETIGKSNSLSSAFSRSQTEASNLNPQQFRQISQMQNLSNMSLSNYANKPSFGTNFNFNSTGSEPNRNNLNNRELNMNTYNRDNQFENNVSRFVSQPAYNQFGSGNQSNKTSASGGTNAKSISNSNWKGAFNTMQW